MNGNFWRAQNKTSRTQLSPRTFADQPSPKCCSIANVFPISSPVNGSSVPWMARGVHELLLDILAVGLSLFRPPCDRAIKSKSPPCRTKRNKYGHPSFPVAAARPGHCRDFWRAQQNDPDSL